MGGPIGLKPFPWAWCPSRTSFDGSLDGSATVLNFDPCMVIFRFWGSMWRVGTVTKFKNSFFPVLICWNDNRVHLNTFKKSVFVSMVPPLTRVGRGPGGEDEVFCS